VSDDPSKRDGLDECSRERIRIPGSIQPHGFLFVLDPSNLSVLAASCNVEEMTGISTSDLIGRTVTDFLVSANAKNLKDLLTLEPDDHSTRVRFLNSASVAVWSGIVHRSNGTILFELWPQLIDDPEDLLAAVQSGSERIRKCDTLEAACAILARDLRRLSGFDRVMVYRFDAEWNGEVLAEHRVPTALSYLGHSFPNSDIPVQARALYLQNPFRLIPDTSYVPSPIVPPLLVSSSQPIDLSMVSLRSVSPVHLEYLANMGVGASMSISLIKDGKLWGLVACHHAEPRLLSCAAMQSCEMLAQTLAWYLGAHERSASAASVVAMRTLENQTRAMTNGSAGFRDRMELIAPGMLDLTKSQGMAFCEGRSVWTAGDAPTHQDILALCKWLSDAGSERFETSNLSNEFPEASCYQSIASGVAARRLPGGWLIWFRSEWPRTLIWAGNPDQVARAKSEQGRINPRKSFASWRKLVTGRSRPWSTADVYSIDEAQLVTMRYLLNDQLERLTENEIALKAAAIRADELNKSKSDFLAGMSHELRTPLNAILGFSEVIASKIFGPVSSKYVDYANDIHRSGNLLLELIDDVLDLAKIDARKLDLREERLNLQAVVSECLKMIQGRADGSHIRLVVDQPAQELSLFADERRIRQLLLNLLSNAVKFTLPGGSVTIRIAVDGDDRISLSVLDTGIGMSEAEIDVAVSRYGRISQNKARKVEGTGLGLPICKSLTEMHGGQFYLKSTPDEGTEVTARFPATRTVRSSNSKCA
jgi:chemotaxis family two-component system sensor kinase Cph1